MVHGVNDNAARVAAMDWFTERGGRARDKAWIGQWDHGSTNGRCGDTEGARTLHPTCRFEQMQYAIHAWFDKHLLQRDVQTGPAVEAFLNGEQAVDIREVMDAEQWGTQVVTADSCRVLGSLVSENEGTTINRDPQVVVASAQPRQSAGSRN
jgi:hypothetical protein